jgi:hypothetical protein
MPIEGGRSGPWAIRDSKGRKKLVRDLAFYNAGYHATKGVRRGLVPIRRLLRRVLRPIFLRQVEMFQEIWDRLDALGRLEESVSTLRDELQAMSHRQDVLAEQWKTTLAFGWDHVALVRRLAVLEDQVASLSGNAATISDDPDSHPSILFPGLTYGQDEPEARSKVC